MPSNKEKLLECKNIANIIQIAENLNFSTYSTVGDSCMFSHLGLEGSLTVSTLYEAIKEGRFKSDAISEGIGTITKRWLVRWCHMREGWGAKFSLAKKFLRVEKKIMAAVEWFSDRWKLVLAPSENLVLVPGIGEVREREGIEKGGV